MPKKRLLYAAILITAAVISGFIYAGQRIGEREFPDTETGFLFSEEEPLEREAEDLQKIQDERIYIHVCGEVASPGVYELAAGSRAFDAITAAGGFTELAAADYLNLAKILQDGEKLMVPDSEMAESQQFMPEEQLGVTGGLVNLNQADLNQLMTLPGIGEAKAKSILKYREDMGSFSRIEDIMNISGIKEAAFEKLKDYVTVK